MVDAFVDMALTETVHGYDTSSVISIRNGYEMQAECNKAGDILFMVIKKDGKVIMEFDNEQAKAFYAVLNGVAGERLRLVVNEARRVFFDKQNDDDEEEDF
jgi:hypothetical protein